MLAAVVRAALVMLCFVSALPAQGGPPGGRPGGPPGGGPPAGVVPGGMPAGVVAGPDSATLQSEAIRVFLDCQGRVRGCDRDFFVTEINFVNWMRDRFDADVQLLVVALTNGGGGNANTITFIGRRGFAGMEDTLVVNSLPNDPEDKIRRDLARAFKLGLARFVAKSPIASRIDMRYAAPFGQRQQVSAANLNDPCNLWLYNVGTNLFVTAEEQQQRLNGSLNLSATRVTDLWKVNLSATGSVREDKFDVPARPGRDAFTLVNEQRTYNASSLRGRSALTGRPASSSVSAIRTSSIRIWPCVRSRPSSTTSSPGRSRRGGSSRSCTTLARTTTTTSGRPSSTSTRRRGTVSSSPPRSSRGSRGDRRTFRSTGSTTCTISIAMRSR